MNENSCYDEGNKTLSKYRIAVGIMVGIALLTMIIGGIIHAEKQLSVDAEDLQQVNRQIKEFPELRGIVSKCIQQDGDITAGCFDNIQQEYRKIWINHTLIEKEN